MPVASVSRMPASTDLMYSRGIVPPTILSTNSYPAPFSWGPSSMRPAPAWPSPSPRARPAADLAAARVPRPLLLGLELDDRVAVLALATGLADEAAIALGC